MPAGVELTEAAVEDLERLIRTHSLPADTKERVKRSLRSLETFPLIGAPLDGSWEGFRFLLGPWRWMLIVYEYFDDENRVAVATIQDGRSSQRAVWAELQKARPIPLPKTVKELKAETRESRGR